MAAALKLTPTLAKRLCQLVDELGEEVVTDEDGSVYEKTAAVWEIRTHAGAPYMGKLEQLGLIILERRPGTMVKIWRLTVAPGAYQEAMQLAAKKERPSISKVAQRADREMRAIPASAARRLRLQGLRGDCRQ